MTMASGALLLGALAAYSVDAPRLLQLVLAGAAAVLGCVVLWRELRPDPGPQVTVTIKVTDRASLVLREVAERLERIGRDAA